MLVYYIVSNKIAIISMYKATASIEPMPTKPNKVTSFRDCGLRPTVSINVVHNLDKPQATAAIGKAQIAAPKYA